MKDVFLKAIQSYEFKQHKHLFFQEFADHLGPETLEIATASIGNCVFIYYYLINETKIDGQYVKSILASWNHKRKRKEDSVEGVADVKDDVEQYSRAVLKCKK